MSKLLSICIPSYNMEQLLGRCVDSMLVDEVLDQLEIIIVNDGSKDGTLAIANDYKQRYPQSVVVIDKPNGHYGSCINASLKVATGKYFRIVDADDWVDSQALAQLVKKLNDLDVDCVCTKYAIQKEDEDSPTAQPIDATFDTVLDLNHYKLPRGCFHMHCLTYKTELLRKIGYVQTEGVCYTDTEYLYVPLSCSKDIYFMNIALYQYLLDRDGQSMARAQVVKNNWHFLKVMKSVSEAHHANLPFNGNEPQIWSFAQSNLIEWAAVIYIFYLEYDKKKENILRSSIAELRKDGLLHFYGFWSKSRMAIFYLWYFSGEKLSKVIMQPFRKLKR